MMHSFSVSSTGHVEDVAKDVKRQFQQVREAHARTHGHETHGAEEYDSTPLDGAEAAVLAVVKGFAKSKKHEGSDRNGINVYASGSFDTSVPNGSTISMSFSTTLAERSSPTVVEAE